MTSMTRVSRRGDVEPFHVMELIKAASARARSHGDVISLCAGQPSTPAPKAVLDAAQRALASGAVLGYTDTFGIMPLRETIAEHYEQTYGLDVDPRQVAVTPGSSGAFPSIFLAAFDAGDTVLMTRPGYPAYRNTLQALGCHAVELDCGPAERFQPTLAMLREWSETNGTPPAGLIVASPANPTGTLITDTELAAIATWCEASRVLLISDEIYHGVTYGQHAACAWETNRSSVVIGSMSKYFSMTGWRIGWALLPEPLVRPVELLHGNLNICASAISQVASIAGFTPEAKVELDGHVERYAVNRELVLRRLPELGITTWAPADGAFYAYADISHLTDDSTQWCSDVLDATGVAVTPGVDFAPLHPEHPTPMDGSRWFRLSFAGGTAEIDEALSRIVGFIGG